MFVFEKTTQLLIRVWTELTFATKLSEKLASNHSSHSLREQTPFPIRVGENKAGKRRLLSQAIPFSITSVSRMGDFDNNSSSRTS